MYKQVHSDSQCAYLSLCLRIQKQLFNLGIVLPNRGHCFSFLRCSLTSRRHNVHSEQCLTQPPLKSSFLLDRKLLQTLAMGQGLAVLICGTAISSQYLATNFHVDTPMLQSVFNYALLCLTYTSMLVCRRGATNTHHSSRLLTHYYNHLWSSTNQSK